MNSTKILSAAFYDRGAYEELNRHIVGKDLDAVSGIVWEEIGEYYNGDEAAEACDADVILTRIHRKMPKKEQIFTACISALEQVSVPNIIKEVVALKRGNIGQKLAAALVEENNSRALPLIEEYLDCQTGELNEEVVDGEVYEGIPIERLAESYAEDNLIKVYPHSLNEHLGGGVPPQTHIVIYAEPECGKSLFAINMAAGFCRDGHKTLYVENEDSGDATSLRFLCRMSDRNKCDVLEDLEGSLALAKQKGESNLIIANLAPGTIHEIEELIKKHKPRCIIVNQIRHLAFKNVDGDVAQLTKAGKEMRRLIKKYDMVGVSIHQAGDSATGKLVLERGDVYMSNTSLPGDADVLLGIGMDVAYDQLGRRMVSLPKNKVTGNHAYFPVGIDKQQSKVISL